MEHESFENNMAAEILNKHFIAVKVDREERADIDSVYMNVCTLLTGSGGWPLTIIMTPDKKPFFAGTYFPLHSSYGRIGLCELFKKITNLWEDDRTSLINSSREIYEHLIKHENKPIIYETPKKSITNKAFQELEKRYDKIYGGFSNAPKFPMPHILMFLIRYGIYENNKKSIEMACETLLKMYQGGIYDHIGGGFSRYSTDEKWLVPHFEKMLYDNALLILAYSEGYSVTKNIVFEKAVRETIAYLISELKNPNGGFYCAQDADSEGEEGGYYTFTKEEILNVLGEESGTRFCHFYHISSDEQYGGNVLNIMHDPHKLKETHYEDDDIKHSKKILYEYRKQRAVLHRDEKQLTSWNAMAIAALAKASYIFDDASWLKEAEEVQEFIDRCLTSKGNNLFVSYKDSIVSHKGLLDDYAFYAWALIELYEASYDISYLEKAALIVDQMICLFWDNEKSGFFLYSLDSEQLLTRPKELYDGALPSGNSVAAYVLTKLYILTADTKWKDCLDRQLSFICGQASYQPSSLSFALLSLMEMLYPSIDIVCTCRDEQAVNFLRLLKSMKPFGTNILFITNNNQSALKMLSPATSNYEINQEQDLYYICENGACRHEAVDKKEAVEIISNSSFFI